MTFVKGRSGNPAGRRPGSRNKVTQLVEEILEDGAEKVTRELLNHACLGQATAMRICFDQLLPRRRGRPLAISLPPVETLADLDKWTTPILNGIADGEVTPEEAAQMLKVVDAVGRRLKATETDARVARLERVVAKLLGKNAGIPEAALASATNLQAQAQPGAPTADAARRRVDPDRAEDPPLASASDLPADRAAAPPEPLPESAAPGEAPLASATNLQADRVADGATAPPERAAQPDAPLASATNLQADRVADGATPSPERAAQPYAPLASATNLQADRVADGATSSPAPAAPPDVRLASASNLQADQAANRSTAPLEGAARPDAPLPSAGNLQGPPAKRHADPPPLGAAADQLDWREAA